MVWMLFNYFKNYQLKVLSFHVTTSIFSLRPQLDFYYSCYCGYAYKISGTLVDPIESCFKSRTNMIWIGYQFMWQCLKFFWIQFVYRIVKAFWKVCFPTSLPLMPTQISVPGGGKNCWRRRTGGGKEGEQRGERGGVWRNAELRRILKNYKFYLIRLQITLFFN